MDEGWIMDPNRRLLDVIDNPQLLQSFLENESSAAGANGGQAADIANQNITTLAGSSISTTNTTTTDTLNPASIAPPLSTASVITTQTITPTTSTPAPEISTSQPAPFTTFPSSPISKPGIATILPAPTTSTLTASAPSPADTPTTTATQIDHQIKIEPTTEAAISESPAILQTTPNLPPATTTEAPSLAQTTPTTVASSAEAATTQAPTLSLPSKITAPVQQVVLPKPFTPTDPQSETTSTGVNPSITSTASKTTNAPTINTTTPSQVSEALATTSVTTTTTTPASTPAPINTAAKTKATAAKTTSSTPTATTGTKATKPKAPRKPRAPKAANNAANTNESKNFNQSTINNLQSGNIKVNGIQVSQSPQTQHTRLSTPLMAGQTIAIQNPQNTQQQGVLIPSSQPMMMPRMPNQIILNRPPGTLLSGQQQFIQIMTPNGPMLLALPTQQAQQQIPSQPQQSQQQNMGPQPNNIIVGSPQIANQSPQTQQQPRPATPMMAGQTLAIQSPQNPQQPRSVMLSSPQPMMMPRMSNQIILNRPNSGPLLPGQQQFIQIMTQNGPMLLALQPSQPQQQHPQHQVTTSASNNTSTMIDFNSRVHTPNSQAHQVANQIRTTPVSTQPVHVQTSELSGTQTQSAQSKPVTTTASSKTVSNSKSGMDLGDLLLDCGILPDDRMSTTQSPSKAIPSPSIQQISSPMAALPQINSASMGHLESSSLTTTPTQAPLTTSFGGPMQQQQPIRITFGPDGQMMMQPPVYGAIRPMYTNHIGQPQMSTIVPNSMIPTSSPMMTLTTSSPSTPNNNSAQPNNDNNNKKSNAKGKGTAVKRSRSKKSDLDKFPTLKTPKIAQQQQQQQLQAVTVVPMTMLVGDQNKVAAGPDTKPNIAQLASGQQVSLAKIVTPVVQTTPLKTAVNSTMIQASIPAANITATKIGQNKANVDSVQINSTQLASAESGNSISSTGMQVSNSTITAQGTNITAATSATSQQQISSSGNVTTNLLQRVNSKPGTVESNPHISSSLMPTLTLTVDTLKIEQNGLKTTTSTNSRQNGQPNSDLKTIQTGGITTLVIHSNSQAQLHNTQLQVQQLQQQQKQRQIEQRAQSILNQLTADQNAALNPQTKKSFESVEDACKRLLRYHVFDTQTVSKAQIQKVDDIFDAAVESLITRKRAIYDKYRLIILKESMKSVPSSEEVMVDRMFVNDELAYIKKERELFRDYEAHLERSLSQTKSDVKSDSKDDCASDYFVFGDSSPKRGGRVDLDSAAHSRDGVDEWLMADKWGESRYLSVPDNEAATAIESILNEELS